MKLWSFSCFVDLLYYTIVKIHGQLVVCYTEYGAAPPNSDTKKCARS